ncbi:MAG TPA: glycosyltransferase, partial [Puia sp.]|nr:glycosyltransferase [Puia sp.]
MRRLLDSIAVQTFRDFEVVVTDDSPGFEVNALCERYKETCNLCYFRNLVPLGSPENWNEAVRKAGGKWIKIMHDDDWFSDANSLSAFAQAADKSPNASFIFSAYRDVFLDENRERVMYVPSRRYKAFLKDATVLFARNIIGPPSVVLYRRSSAVRFDPAVKWVVDIDFYIRSLRAGKPAYIDKVLVNVGL